MYAKLISVAMAGLIALPLIGCQTAGEQPEDPARETDAMADGTASSSSLVAGGDGARVPDTGPAAGGITATDGATADARQTVALSSPTEGTVYRDSAGNEVFLFSGTPTADDLLAQLASDQKTRQIVFLDPNARQPQPQPSCAAQFKSGKTLGLNVTFPVNSAALTAEAKAQLNSVAELLQRYDCLEFSISGHTDSSGSPTINKPLSERRAQAVRDYLVQEQGLSAERFSASGYGADRLLQDLPETDPKHRRVEFTVS